MVIHGEVNSFLLEKGVTQAGGSPYTKNQILSCRVFRD